MNPTRATKGLCAARPDERVHGARGAAPRRAALHLLPLPARAQRAQPRAQEALPAQALQAQLHLLMSPGKIMNLSISKLFFF